MVGSHQHHPQNRPIGAEDGVTPLRSLALPLVEHLADVWLHVLGRAGTCRWSNGLGTSILGSRANEFACTVARRSEEREGQRRLGSGAAGDSIASCPPRLISMPMRPPPTPATRIGQEPSGYLVSNTRTPQSKETDGTPTRDP